MKVLMFAIMLAATTAAFAPQASAYDACAGNNSRPCVNARNAFAEHHGGAMPGQFENRAYNNRAYNSGAYYNNNNNGRYAAPRHHHHHHWDHDHDHR